MIPAGTEVEVIKPGHEFYGKRGRVIFNPNGFVCVGFGRLCNHVNPNDLKVIERKKRK